MYESECTTVWRVMALTLGSVLMAWTGTQRYQGVLYQGHQCAISYFFRNRHDALSMDMEV